MKSFPRTPEVEARRKAQQRAANRRRMEREARERAVEAALSKLTRCRVCKLLEPHECVFYSVALRRSVDIL